MITKVAQLDYAPKPPLNRRWLRRWIVLALIVGIGFPLWKWGPGMWHRAQLLYWQRQCVTYSPPADQVVYEEDPAKAAALLAADSQYTSYAVWRAFSEGSSSRPAVTAVTRVPRCWDRLLSCLGTRGTGLLQTSGTSTGAIIFLGELHSPNGMPYLVALNYAPELDTFHPEFIEGYNWTGAILKPGSIRRQPQWVPGRRLFTPDMLIGLVPTPRVRVYAGQPDPNDLSHFTVRYQMWGREDVLDGRIDDVGIVTLKPRNPPDEQ